MKIFDTILLKLVLIEIPIMAYLIYIAYSKTLKKEENNLVFIIIIFTQAYLIIRYNFSLYNLPIIILNIPLILLYFKNKKRVALILSAVLIIYYYSFYNNYLLFLIFEYLLYFFLNKKIKNINLYIIIFTILKTICLIAISKDLLSEIFIENLLFYFITLFTIHLLEKTEDVLKLHKNIKEIENDKQIKTSLFRITHEIKNPIAVCKGYLDMYDEKNISEFKNYVPILKEEINRTLILLEDFLAMNKLKINKDLLDINLLLEEVLNNMKFLFIKNNIKLKSNIKEDEIFINGDYNRLTQVFINILKNSIEALENKKQKQIQVWTKLTNNNINIYIKDNGIGISKKILKKIKDPFYTTKIKGTGLGVSLSNEIINAHNGILKYESKENEYTLVTIILPLEKAI